MSSRALTREHGSFTRDSVANRSLTRGLQLLRAFSHGAELLGNGELAARTGLARSTVSRLTHTLVEEGFLDYDIPRQAYRLAAVVLSLADTFTLGDRTGEIAFEPMRVLSVKERINVGLAVADRLEMVYVVAFRESRRGVFRRAVPGSRYPIEITAGGLAFVAGLAESARERIVAQLRDKHGRQWRPIWTGIDGAIAEVAAQGYCVAYWAPGMTGLGTPLVAPNGHAYSLNITYHSADTPKSAETRYGRLLLGLREEILQAWEAAVPATPTVRA
jgi:DNA-binding IclR family transcriptional regulator